MSSPTISFGPWCFPSLRRKAEVKRVPVVEALDLRTMPLNSLLYFVLEEDGRLDAQSEDGN